MPLKEKSLNNQVSKFCFRILLVIARRIKRQTKKFCGAIGNEISLSHNIQVTKIPFHIVSFHIIYRQLQSRFRDIKRKKGSGIVGIKNLKNSPLKSGERVRKICQLPLTVQESQQVQSVQSVVILTLLSLQQQPFSLCLQPQTSHITPLLIFSTKNFTSFRNLILL